MLSDVDPVYGVPRMVLGATGAMEILLRLPPFMAILSGVTVVFSVLAWRGKYWTGLARVHYILVTAAGLDFMWVLLYTNLL